MPHATTAPSHPVDLVLHIGSGKTGSTSVQQFLRRNRRRLADAGVLYPRTPGERRHIRLGLFVRPDDDLGKEVGWRRQGYDSPAEFRRDFEMDLLREIAGSGLQRVLLSDESLYGASDGALERLRSFTDRVADGIRVVVYLRRQDDHLVSRYQEVVKVGETRRLAERVEQMDLSRTYDYYARLRAWRRVVEPTAIVVRTFEPERFSHGSLYRDFLDAVGVDVPVDALEEVAFRNRSMDAESVEFLRILNLYRVEHEGAEPGLIDHRGLARRLASASTGATLTLPEGVLDRFMARWEESNRAVATEFLGDQQGDLFRSARRSRNTTTQQRLDPDRLDHFLELTGLPERVHGRLRQLVEREAASGENADHRAAGPRSA